jgi:hypothetical protein
MKILGVDAEQPHGTEFSVECPESRSGGPPDIETSQLASCYGATNKSSGKPIGRPLQATFIIWTAIDDTYWDTFFRV